MKPSRLFLVLAATSCLGVTAASSGPVFREATRQFNLSLANAAACWVDVNNDNRPDLCAGGTVWMNKGGKGFSQLIGRVGSVVAADYDNDGFADLFSWSQLRLYHNDNGNGFSLAALPELPPCVSRGACWGDFNNDGFVDLYVGGYEDWNKGITYPDMILLNQRGKAFKLTWTESRYRARGVTACDFDQDGDLDVYVSNYRLQPNVLWVNLGGAKFADLATKHNTSATSPGFGGGHSIGAVWADFDNDGLFDLFAGNFAHRDSRGDQPKSRFLRNLGKSARFLFNDLGPCGIYYQESYASPAAGDYDNDGEVDLFFTTVYATASFGRKNYPVLFRNDGRFEFTDVTADAHLAKLPATYQAAWADIDRDGDLDLVTGGKLFVNEATGRHWLELRLKGDGRRVNRSAVGAQARLLCAGRTLTRQVEAGTGEGNQNDLTLHFGLGTVAGPLTLDILWPGGATQRVTGVTVDRLHEVVFRPR